MNVLLIFAWCSEKTASCEIMKMSLISVIIFACLTLMVSVCSFNRSFFSMYKPTFASINLIILDTLGIGIDIDDVSRINTHRFHCATLSFRCHGVEIGSGEEEMWCPRKDSELYRGGQIHVSLCSKQRRYNVVGSLCSDALHVRYM